MRALAAAIYLALAAALACPGCVQLPRPEELKAFDALRKTEAVKMARARQGKLVEQSDTAHEAAVEAWEDNRNELARHWAIMGTIKLQSALVAVILAEEQARVEALRRDHAAVKKERGGLAVRLAQTTELIDLHEELSVAQSFTMEKALHLDSVQHLNRAEKLVGEARLALKMAETVEAQRHASATYAMAKALLKEAAAALAAKKTARATAKADMAKLKADEAFKKANPLHLRGKKIATRDVRTRALQREAAAVVVKAKGVTATLTASGGTQKLTIRVTFLFKPHSTRTHPKKRKILAQIGELLKKYPEYPLEVRGFTSRKVPTKKRYDLSRGRARTVADLLAAAGVAATRMVISGQGANKLVGYQFSPINDRVEIGVLIP